MNITTEKVPKISKASKKIAKLERDEVKLMKEKLPKKRGTQKKTVKTSGRNNIAGKIQALNLVQLGEVNYDYLECLFGDEGKYASYANVRVPDDFGAQKSGISRQVFDVVFTTDAASGNFCIIACPNSPSELIQIFATATTAPNTGATGGSPTTLPSNILSELDQYKPIAFHIDVQYLAPLLNLQGRIVSGIASSEGPTVPTVTTFSIEQLKQRGVWNETIVAKKPNATWRWVPADIGDFEWQEGSNPNPNINSLLVLWGSNFPVASQFRVRASAYYEFTLNTSSTVDSFVQFGWPKGGESATTQCLSALMRQHGIELLSSDFDHSEINKNTLTRTAIIEEKKDAEKGMQKVIQEKEEGIELQDLSHEIINSDFSTQMGTVVNTLEKYAPLAKAATLLL